MLKVRKGAGNEHDKEIVETSWEQRKLKVQERKKVQNTGTKNEKRMKEQRKKSRGKK